MSKRNRKGIQRDGSAEMGVSSFLAVKDTYCLRGIAMLMIIISHTYNGYPVADASCYFPSFLQWLHFELWGGMGVSVFLFLSGYGLFYTLSRREYIGGQYIASKLRRLLEPFVIYWIVEVIVLALFDRGELTTHLLEEVATFSIHPDVENWFFKVIAVTYVITIALFKCRMRDSVRVAALLAMAIAYLVVMKELGFGQWWYNSILCFPAGAAVAWQYDRMAALPAVVMSMAGALLMLAVYQIHMNTIVFHLAFVLFCVYVIKVVNIRSRVLFFIGYHSFVFYFIECPVMEEITMFCYSHFPAYCLLTVLVTFVLSFLCVRGSEAVSSQVKKRKQP